MTLTWTVFLWVLAFVLFLVAAFVNPPRVSLVALGLAALTAGLLATQIG